MSILSTKGLNKKSGGNALQIGEEATQAKLKDKSVINSTIGMLFDENGNFFTFESVKKALADLNEKEKYSYISTPGLSDYHDALYHWIFQDNYDLMLKGIYIKTIATPGGTGAICNTFANYLDENEKVLLPSLMWSNYIQIAFEQNLGYQTYDLFSENRFNLKDLKKKISLLQETQKRILLVINDPCHNPTGYSMKGEEWDSLIEILNEASLKTPIVLLYDMAYIDYSKDGFKYTRNNILKFKRFTSNVLTILAFSGSKTLGLYGLRVGAQIAISSSSDVIEEFSRANEYSARSMWSLTSTIGQNIIIKVLTIYKNLFIKEIEQAKNMLVKRANLFLELLNKYKNIKCYPYDCGFFVLIKVDNPQKVYEELKKKGLYTIPLKEGIRLTLSSITLNEIERALKIINDVVMED